MGWETIQQLIWRSFMPCVNTVLAMQNPHVMKMGWALCDCFSWSTTEHNLKNSQTLWMSFMIEHAASKYCSQKSPIITSTWLTYWVEFNPINQSINQFHVIMGDLCENNGQQRYTVVTLNLINDTSTLPTFHWKELHVLYTMNSHTDETGERDEKMWRDSYYTTNMSFRKVKAIKYCNF